MTSNPETTFRVEMTVEENILPRFLQLLEAGVELPVAATDVSIRQFLCGELDIAEDYLDQRIQTIFLNARPVDDVDTARVNDGAVLALSAAMPGLVGATMRKGGRYAPFRRVISDEGRGPAGAGGPGRVVLKLFNMVRSEVGPGLLAAGVGVPAGRLAALFQDRDDRIARGCRLVKIDGEPIEPAAIPMRIADCRQVHLMVTVAGSEQ